MLLSDTPLHVPSSGRGRQAITLLQEVEWGHSWSELLHLSPAGS